MLGLPLFADQHYNNALLINRGMGLFQDARDVNADELIRKMHSLLSEPDFRKNARRLRAKLMDEPFKPEERFVRLLEYAARHEDRGEMDLHVTRLDFVHRHNLDIYLPLLLGLLMTTVVAHRSVRWLCSSISSAWTGPKQKTA